MQTMTKREFAKAMLDDSFRERFAKSWSPGPVCEQLGVSRQRVHQLCEEGKLDTLKVVNEDGSLAWINIFEDSVKAHLRTAKRKAAKRVSHLERLLQAI